MAPSTTPSARPMCFLLVMTDLLALCCRLRRAGLLERRSAFFFCSAGIESKSDLKAEFRFFSPSRRSWVNSERVFRSSTAVVFSGGMAQQSTNQPPAAAAATSSKPETVEQRITTLKAALKITPDQEFKWNAVAQSMRDNASAMEKLVATKRAIPPEKTTAVDDLKTYQEFTQLRLDGLKNPDLGLQVTLQFDAGRPEEERRPGVREVRPGEPREPGLGGPS